MEYLRDIWAGYLQGFSTDAARSGLLIVDFLLVAIAIYFFLRLLNSRAGWRYLGTLLAGLGFLILSSYFALQGLHLVAQAALIMLVVTLPVLFRDEFSQLIQGSPTSTAVASSAASLAIVAALASAVVVLAGNGAATKTGELPDAIPIQAINLAEGLSAKLGSERSVRIVVSAPRQTWKSLNTDSFSAIVDVAKQAEGTYDLPIAVTSKVSGVQIRRVKPARVSVAVEPVIKKTVPVVVRFSGQAGNDLVPDTPVITPDKVEITGAKSVVTDLTQVIAPISLNGETAKIEQKVTLAVQDAGGEIIQGITVTPDTATVSVALVKAGKIKTVGIQAAVTGTPKAGWWVKSVTVTPPVVAVTGPVDALEALTAISTESISVNGLEADTTVQVQLSLPSGITIADSTKKVTVKITLDKTSTTKSVSPQIIYSNVNGSLQVTAINPGTVTTQVAGLASILSSLSDSSVHLNLDLGAYQSAGTYSVTIKNGDFQLPDGVNLVSFLPSVISVTLSNK